MKTCLCLRISCVRCILRGPGLIPAGWFGCHRGGHTDRWAAEGVTTGCRLNEWLHCWRMKGNILHPDQQSLMIDAANTAIMDMHGKYLPLVLGPVRGRETAVFCVYAPRLLHDKKLFHWSKGSFLVEWITNHQAQFGLVVVHSFILEAEITFWDSRSFMNWHSI